MPLLLILGALGIGGFLWYKSSHPDQGSGPVPPGINPSQDADVQKTVAAALQNERDPNVLIDLANKLQAAGYSQLAQTVANRAHQLAAGPAALPQFPPGTILQAAPVSMAMAAAPVMAAANLPTAQQQVQSVHAPRLVHYAAGDYRVITGQNVTRIPAGMAMHLPGYRGGKYDLR